MSRGGANTAVRTENGCSCCCHSDSGSGCHRDSESGGGGSGGAGTASAAGGEEGGDGGEHGEGVDIDGERLGTIEIVRGDLEQAAASKRRSFTNGIATQLSIMPTQIFDSMHPKPHMSLGSIIDCSARVAHELG